VISIFFNVSEKCSKVTTQVYSTSFSSAIKTLHKDLRPPIYNIYGLVRFADEIVDSFHNFNKEALLQEFKEDTFKAIKQGISLNPILNSFQKTVTEYKIPHDLIIAFFNSMEMDLQKQEYSESKYNEYIYGSAEVVGLMCLCVFCDGNKEEYDKLKPGAQALGAAFQKVNFLRDLKADNEGLDRTYFPNVDFKNFSQNDKLIIEKDIEQDFEQALIAITQLPVKARFGVYVAYKYYISLFEKIKHTNEKTIMEERIRIPDYQKAYILARASIKNSLNLI
jgi:15-cis-phytoene synthase